MCALPCHTPWSPRIWALFRDGRAGVLDDGKWRELWRKRANTIGVDPFCTERLPGSSRHSAVPPLPGPDQPSVVACARPIQVLDATEDACLPELVAVAYTSGHVTVLDTITGEALTSSRCV
jgi:hypothetical protein